MDIEQKQYAALELYDLPKKESEAQKLLVDLLSNHQWIAKEYPSSSIAYVNTFSTLVPSAIYQEKDRNAYLNANIAESELIANSQNVTNLGLQCIYGIPERIRSIVKKHFPAIKEFHHTGTFLNALSNDDLFTQDTTVFVNIHDDLFDLVVSKDKKLLLVNTYSYKTKEDYLFFLLNTCEQLKLELENTNFTIFGRVEKTSQLIDIMGRYIHNTQYGKRTPKFKYSYKLSELPEHYFFNLFSQYLCV